MPTAALLELFAAHPVPASGPPVAGYTAWYDPSDLATITDAGAGAVSGLADKSANAYHLTQTTAGNRPTTGTRTQNSLNVIDFDGTNDRLLPPVAFALNQPLTIFVVALSDDGADATAQVFIDGTTNTVRVGKHTTNQWIMNAGSDRAGGTADTSAHVHGAEFNGASSVRYVDGASVASGAAGATNYTAGIRLGCSQSGSQFWDGWIGEVLVYPSALSTGDRNSVEAYLKAKWNTP